MIDCGDCFICKNLNICCVILKIMVRSGYYWGKNIDWEKILCFVVMLVFFGFGKVVIELGECVIIFVLVIYGCYCIFLIFRGC